ncbi:unnamed protein product [Arctia plantaginis]|uniref:Uncharacterized protein n=1 Tax=Arctia plantaginis TaxID=874455 RepID=A0A8S1AF97_ARCPL|nr:unnamed protein product [Arctia plantaginis]
MACCKKTIKKTLIDATPECFCIPTEGKAFICVRKNEEGKIILCQDCKAVKTEDDEWKCVDSSCICIPTKGKTCLCICNNEGNQVEFGLDCSCINAEVCKINFKNCGKRGCVCFPTDGKDSICVCKR